MRMVKRTDCTYEEFEAMRQAILDKAPYGLINDIYDKKNRIAYLYFWDSDYIPSHWEQWVVRPISKKSQITGVSEEHEKPQDKVEAKILELSKKEN